MKRYFLGVVVASALFTSVFSSCKKDDNNDKKKNVPATSIALNKLSLTLEIGESETLVATVLPDNATDKTVMWESSNPSVATVNNGRVTAESAGTAKISVRTKDGYFMAICEVTVLPAMEDNYAISVTAGLYSISNGYEKVSVEYGIPAYYFNVGVKAFDTEFRVSITNKSGKTIPAGVPFKYMVKINNTPIAIYGTTTVVSAVTQNDIPAGVTVRLFSLNEYTISSETSQIGLNSICGEVLQLGKKEYPTPYEKCAEYSVKLMD